MKKYFSILSFAQVTILLFSLSSFGFLRPVMAQLVVTQNGAATTLAQNIAGSGVTISNATLNCGNNAAGTFTYTGTDLGLPGGILLTTGLVTQAATPNGSTFMNTVNGNNFTDLDLTAISPQATYDVCILQFDFVPICDSMRFSFVFGSDEYPKYINKFNDAFGVFLTGPIPLSSGGGKYNAQNIATLPGVLPPTPVEINTVNGGWPIGTGASNPSFYVDNYPPDGTGSHNFDFYGYTIPLTSVTPVVACQKYTMKIAVADAVDGNNDSGVFIKGNSVTCVAVPPVVTATAIPSPGCGVSASAYVTVSGYTGTPTYSWSLGAQTTDTIKNLPAGTYNCTVGMTSLCGAPIPQTVSVTVAGPVSAVVASASASAPSCSSTSGSVSVTTSGGAANYTWEWSSVLAGSTGTTSTTGLISTLTGLSSGVYTVTVTDSKNCSATSTATVNNIGGLTASTQTPVNINCFGQHTGSDSVATSGGASPVTFIWSPSGGNGQTASGLGAGTYSVKVTDGNGCTVITTVALTQPATALSVSTTNTSAACGQSNGQAIASSSGGNGGFTYSWNTTSVLSDTINGVTAGIYTVIVTDSKGCTGTSTANIGNASGPTLSAAAATTIKCFGDSTGSATATATGGSANYTYSWSNGVTAITNALTSQVSNLPANTYTVTITDANGCSAVSTVIIAPPGTGNPLAPVTSAVPATCSGSNGSVSVNISGGTNPYSILWSDASASTGQTVNGLAAGTYTVTVTDGNSCSKISTAIVVNNGAAIISLSTSSPTYCIGQMAQIIANVTGGTGSYTYAWSGGNVSLTGPGPQTVQDSVTTSYSLVVTDSLGCVTTKANITVNVNPGLTVTASTAGVSVCLGATDTLKASANGGSKPYTFNWSNGTNTGTGSPFIITSNVNTTYTVTVTDNCGSPPATSTISVSVNPLPVVNMTSTNTSGCNLPLCANFTGIPSGSCSSVAWNFGDNRDTSGILTPTHCYTSPGAYTVIFSCTDGNGCTGADTLKNLVNVYTKPHAAFSYGPQPLIQGTVLNFTNQTSNGSAYFWNFGDPTSGGDTSSLTNPSHTFNDSAGKYCILMVAYNSNCIDSVVQCIEMNHICTFPDSLPNIFTPNHDGINDIFTVNTAGLSQLYCTLYNRWGMKIYDYNAIETGWDGRTFADNVAPAGTYYYTFDATCLNGKKREAHGFIVLLR